MSSLAVDVHASLDLSGPVGRARDALLAHLGADPTLATLLSGNPAALVSGEFGATLDGLGSGLLASPEQLLAPLERALRELAGHLDLGPLGQLNELLDLLAQAAGLAEKVVRVTAPDIPPLELGAGISGGGSLGDVVNLVLDHVDLPNRLAPIGDLRAAVAAIDGLVVTGDVGSLVDALAPVLLPLPIPALRQLRAHFDLFDARLARWPDRLELHAALDEWALALDVAAAAEAPDLAALAAVRLKVSAALDAAIDIAGRALDALDLPGWLAELRRMLGLLPQIPAVKLDMLTADLAAEIARIRVLIGAVSDAAILEGIATFKAQAHGFLDGSLGGVSAMLDSVEARLVELLATLPTRAFRAQLTGAVNDLIVRIDGLGIDAVPNAVDDALADLRAVVDGDVVGRVRAAVSGVVGQVEAAVSALEGLLGEVTGSITAAVDEVQPVLVRVQTAVAGFQANIDEVVRLRADIDLAGAARQSVAATLELQEAVTKLTGGGALPEALRPVLEQAAEALESIDLSALLAVPAAEAVGQLRVELPDELTALLADVAALLRDALPVTLIAEVDAPVIAVSEALAGFDPADLLGGLTEHIDAAAGKIESLDPRPHVAGAEEAFRAALAQLDRLDPVALLAPVSAVYDRLLAKLDGVDMHSVGDRLLGGFEAAGAPLNEVVSTAARRLGTESKPPRAPVAGLGAPVQTPPPADRPAPLYRPGDTIRALGTVLDRVRLALAPVDDAVLVPAFRELHALSTGLSGRASPGMVPGQLRAAIARLEPPRLDASLPQAVRLRFAWDRASARHDLDASTSPTVLFEARTPKLDAFRRRVDGLLGDVSAVSPELSVFCVGMKGAIPGGLAVEIDGRGPVDAFLAQLDPEPVAAALDALVEEAATRLMAVGDALAEALDAIRLELDVKLRALGPAAIAERLTRLLLLARQELDSMHPAELGRDVRPLLLALRSRIEAWSPLLLASRVADTLVALAAALRALDPAALLGDLSAIDGLAGRVAALAPGRQLAPLADRLGALGEQLAGLDVEASVSVITETAADVLVDLGAAVDIVLAGLADLLRALGSQAQLSVSIDVEVSVR